MSDIRKVSQNQTELARKIASGQEVITYGEFTCSRFCWTCLRAQVGLEVISPLACRVTLAAKEWAARVLAHLERRKDKRPAAPGALIRRKMLRAQRAGMLA